MLMVYKLFHNLFGGFLKLKLFNARKDHQEQDIRISMAIFF